jgi:glutamate carboxypeptidase
MHKIQLPFLALLLLANAIFMEASESGLSVQEQDIAQWISDHSEKSLGSLEVLLAIDSPTENHAGQREAGEFFKAHFEDIGFATRWMDMREATGRGGHFQAELDGGSGKRVLLLGHLDTVLPASAVWREDNMLFGSGAGDMKGGDMVILFALQALHQAGALDDRRIIVHFTGDEESVGRPIDVARAPMKDAARRSDVVLSFEGGRANTAVVARRSSSSWHMVVESPTGHSSRVFSDELGDGAIYEAARILNAFRENMKGEKYLTFNVSLIAGGTTAEMQKSQASAWGKSNIVPAIVRVRGDLRVLSLEQLERAKSNMTDIVNSWNLPNTTASIEFSDSYPPMSPTPENYELLAQLSQVSEDLGYGAVDPFDPGARGAGDISFVAPLLPGLDGLGVRGHKSHAEGEHMEIDSLVRQTQRAALLIYRLTR